MTFQQLRLLYFKTEPGILPHVKWVFWNKSERLFFYLLLSQRDLSSMWWGSWIRLLTGTRFFCSMFGVAGWCPLKKIAKHATLFYLCILWRVFEKAREISETESILWELCDYRPQFTWSQIQHRRFVKNLQKVLVLALKNKKSSHDDMRENLHFKQSHLNYINNQKQKKNTRLVSIGLDGSLLR